MPSKVEKNLLIFSSSPVLRQGNSEPLLTWTVKRINLQRKSIWLTPVLFSILPLLMISTIFELLETDPGSFYWMSGTVLAGEAYCIYFTLRPSIFHYRIYPECGEFDVQLHYAKYTKHIFNGIAVIAIIVLLGLAVFVGSWLFLLGPVALMIISALNIMEWKPPPPELETSMVWEKYNTVTIDRRYRMIVVHRAGIDIGFEARLPNKELFEQYLAFLRTVLPEVTTYREEVWKW